MPRITRCVCTDRTFEDLLVVARERCLDFESLCDFTRAGRNCGLCRPYLRESLATGRVVFDEVLVEDVASTASIAAPSDVESACAEDAGGAVVLSWSGGKDSALALHRLRADPRYEVVGLLTVLSREHRRISHHGVREELLDAQAESLGLPIDKVWFPPDPGTEPTMAAFDTSMASALAAIRARGVERIAHGDIYLEDLRAYRERKLAAAGMRGVFPLWGESPRALLAEFVRLGFSAVLTCVTEKPAVGWVGVDWVGARIDATFADRVPADIDPCGENGEYHSFVERGPIFSVPVPVEPGEAVVRDTRVFLDLLPVRTQSVATSPSCRNPSSS